MFFRLLRNANYRRKQLNIKLAKGTMTKINMLQQIDAELQILDVFLKKIDVSLCLVYITTTVV